MSPRQRRLASDFEQLSKASEAGQMRFKATGDPPERYEVEISAAGLAERDGRLVSQNDHAFRLYLHRDYPRRPPVIEWETPIFHPNLLGPERNGGVCIGAWSASESLPDLIERLIDLVEYRSFSVDDALDTRVASWFRDRGLEPGLSSEYLIDTQTHDPSEEWMVEVKP